MYCTVPVRCLECVLNFSLDAVARVALNRPSGTSGFHFSPFFHRAKLAFTRSGLKMTDQRRVPIDSRSSWIIALAASLVLSCNVWTFRCAGLLYVAFTEELSVSPERASWPIVVFSSTASMFAPVAGATCANADPSTVFIIASSLATLSVALASWSRDIIEITISMGFMQGICASFPMTLVGPLVTQYLDRYRTRAMGVLFAGPAVTTIILPTLMQMSLDRFGLQWTLLLMAGFSSLALPASLLIRVLGPPEQPHLPTTVVVPLKRARRTQKGRTKAMNQAPLAPSNQDLAPQRVAFLEVSKPVRRGTPQAAESNELDCGNGTQRMKKDNTVSVKAETVGVAKSAKKPGPFAVFRHKWFYLVAMLNVTFIFVNSTLLNLIVALASDKELSHVVAGNLLALFAIGDLAGRVGSGWIVDKGYLTRECLLIVNYLLLSGALTGLGVLSDPLSLCTLAVFIGWLLGSTMILFTDIARDRLGLSMIAQALGWSFCFGGMLILTRPSMISYFYHTIGSFDPIMYLLSALLVIVAAIYTVFLWLDKTEPPSEAAHLDHLDSADDLDIPSYSHRRDRASSFTASLASL